MNIKRFFAENSDAALAQAKATLGEDVVVFSLREISGGVEVLATANEQSNDSAATVQPATSNTHSWSTPPFGNKILGNQGPTQRLLQFLNTMGIEQNLAERLLNEHSNINYSTPATAIRDALSLLAHSIPTVSDNPLKNGTRLALLGLRNSGKTTTLLKLARHYCSQNSAESIAIIDASGESTNNHSQLQTFASARNISLATAANSQELEQQLTRFSYKSVILIDTPSLGQHDLRSPNEIVTATITESPLQHLLIVPTELDHNASNLMISHLGSVGVDGMILTKVDTAAGLGTALSSAITHQLPVAFWSDGAEINSHLYPANSRHLVEKTLSIIKASARSGEAKAHLLGDLHLLM